MNIIGITSAIVYVVYNLPPQSVKDYRSYQNQKYNTELRPEEAMLLAWKSLSPAYKEFQFWRKNCA